MKFSSLEGVVIFIKSDQKATRKWYENNLKSRRGVCTVTVQAREPEVMHYINKGLKHNVESQSMNLEELEKRIR